MYTIEYRAMGEYKIFSRKDTLRSAKREAKNLNYYSGWIHIRIGKPDGTYIQVTGGDEN